MIHWMLTSIIIIIIKRDVKGKKKIYFIRNSFK